MYPSSSSAAVEPELIQNFFGAGALPPLACRGAEAVKPLEPVFAVIPQASILRERLHQIQSIAHQAFQPRGCLRIDGLQGLSNLVGQNVHARSFLLKREFTICSGTSLGAEGSEGPNQVNMRWQPHQAFLPSTDRPKNGKSSGSPPNPPSLQMPMPVGMRSAAAFLGWNCARAVNPKEYYSKCPTPTPEFQPKRRIQKIHENYRFVKVIEFPKKDIQLINRS